MNKSSILIFASGSPDGGGSGFEKLAQASRGGVLEADIAGVVSNHEHGGVRERADALGVPFTHFPGPWTADRYQQIARESGANFFALSGWLKRVGGLDPKTRFNSKTVFNIHPGPLPDFGGAGMYGHRVHEAVLEAFRRGELNYSHVTMHFVTDEYDRGPVIFRLHVRIFPDDTPDTLAVRVNAEEHRWQPVITNMVVNGLIRWDGEDPASLRYPAGYMLDRFE